MIIILFRTLGVSHILVKPSPWALLGVKTMKLFVLHFFPRDTPRVSSRYTRSYGEKKRGQFFQKT